jgi:hypothetical protein
VPLPVVGAGVRASVRGLTATAESVRRADQVVAGGVPATPLQVVSTVATATGRPVVPAVAGYLDDKGVASGPPGTPDVRVRRPCSR